MGGSSGQSGTRRRRRRWWTLPDDQLLRLRLCDLDLTLEGSIMQRRVERLYDELTGRDLTLRPHVWISSDWFSPDGVPGIAVPFCLAHERLMKLEKRMMLDVEGGTERQCMKILRHEAGHAYCTAYRLHYRKRWRETFGRFSEPYPEAYKPNVASHRFVLHFEGWYAQAHPAEDFAETFAVWLQPRSQWRREYAGWPALRKLEYVDEVMTEIAGTVPPVRSRKQIEPLGEIRMTLREYYRRKQRRFAPEWPDYYDHHLLRLFSADPKYARRPTAASFLRRVRPEVREAVSLWTGVYSYTIDQVLRDMIDRCRELGLRLAVPERDARLQTMLMVTAQTMNFLHSGQHHFFL